MLTKYLKSTDLANILLSEDKVVVELPSQLLELEFSDSSSNSSNECELALKPSASELTNPIRNWAILDAKIIPFCL